MVLMKQTIKIKGKIKFDPINRTTKHHKQGSWKKLAMVIFDGDLSEYYAWFLKKRYNLTLNKPLRNSHITFINDRESDMNGKWGEMKEKYQSKEIEIVLSIDPITHSRSSGHWWLNIPEEDRCELHNLRGELGLSRPYWGLHMSLGYANDNNLAHSKYIHKLISKYGY